MARWLKMICDVCGIDITNNEWDRRNIYGDKDYCWKCYGDHLIKVHKSLRDSGVLKEKNGKKIS